MTPPVEPGDIVRLSSGGPPMRVVEVAGRFALCRWRDAASLDHESEAVFRLDALVFYRPRIPGGYS